MYTLGIDIGSTATKAVVLKNVRISTQARLSALAQAPLEPIKRLRSFSKMATLLGMKSTIRLQQAMDDCTLTKQTSRSANSAVMRAVCTS